jgi:uncharacterized protein YndB with AHSA1/START domain
LNSITGAGSQVTKKSGSSFTTTTYEFAFVPGDEWRFIMHGPDGTDYHTRVLLRQIVAPSRLVYDNEWSLPGAPLAFTISLALESSGKKTAISMRLTFADAEAMKMAEEVYGVLDEGTQTMERRFQPSRG